MKPVELKHLSTVAEEAGMHCTCLAGIDNIGRSP
jgi:hypothetical protein